MRARRKNSFLLLLFYLFTTRYKLCQTLERALEEEANLPLVATVHVELPVFSTPLEAMHMWAAEIQIITPAAVTLEWLPITFSKSSAKSEVSRSCTCRRLPCLDTIAWTNFLSSAWPGECQYATWTTPWKGNRWCSHVVVNNKSRSIVSSETSDVDVELKHRLKVDIDDDSGTFCCTVCSKETSLPQTDSFIMEA